MIVRRTLQIERQSRRLQRIARFHPRPQIHRARRHGGATARRHRGPPQCDIAFHIQSLRLNNRSIEWVAIELQIKAVDRGPLRLWMSAQLLAPTASACQTDRRYEACFARRVEYFQAHQWPDAKRSCECAKYPEPDSVD